jgi:hypothetical protein
MKKKAINATVEELIADLTHHEDPDSSLVISGDGMGGILVMRLDGSFYVHQPTLQEALVSYGQRTWRKDHKPWMDAEDSGVNLDWRVNDISPRDT